MEIKTKDVIASFIISLPFLIGFLGISGVIISFLYGWFLALCFIVTITTEKE